MVSGKNPKLFILLKEFFFQLLVVNINIRTEIDKK